MSPSSGTTAVLVLGMHRSGTSLLSSLLKSLGACLGDNFVPADIHNPAGYFEDKECIDIQERLLEALGQPWHGKKGMLPFPSQWWHAPDLQPLLDELEGWIDRRIASGARIWALKDPRTTRFLPMWQELLQIRGVTPRYVLAVRDPAAVVASEVARDNVPAQRIYHTWLRYNMEALLYSGADLAEIVIYSQWFTDGMAQLKRLAAALNAACDDNECADILDRCVRNDLHRQDGSREVAPTWASHFYARLQALAEDVTTSASARIATDMEYCDAILRQGETPDSEGDVQAVLASADGLPEALNLARTLTARGKRVVVASLEVAQEAAPAGVASVVVDYNGPPLAGAVQRVRDAYILWVWLQQRAYAELHIEGGSGLASSCLDARRQGLPDFNGSIHVHYFKRPFWLREDGVLHLKGMLDAQAFCLEGRLLLDPRCQIHAPHYLKETLRRLVAQASDVSHDLAPEATGKPLVSICVTHYNRPDMLSDCLNSIRLQHYGFFEVILVDDGSTHPAASAFLDSLQDEFELKGWTLIRQDNRYLGAARNAGAQAAQGDYLFFLDDDNLLMADGVERAVQTAQRTGADILTAVMAMFNGPAGYQPKRADQLALQAGGNSLLGLFDNNFGDASALISRKCWAEVGKYTEDRNVGGEDWEFFAKAVIKGWNLQHSLKPFSWYRVSASGMARAGDWWKDYRRALRSYEVLLPPALRELPALAGMLNRRVTELEPFQPEAVSLRSQVSELHGSVALTSAQLEQKQHDLMQVQNQQMRTQQQLAQVQDQQMRTQQQLAQTRLQQAQLEGHLERAKQDTTRLKSLRVLDENARSKVEHELSMMTTRRDELELQFEQARQKEAELQRRLDDATHTVNAIRSSTSWRMMGPVRSIGRRLPPSFRQVSRRVAYAAWLIVTLQLGRRIRSRAARRRLIASSSYFDASWYLETNPDLASKGVDPAHHYARFGGLEGRDPGPTFSCRLYLERHSEAVTASGGAFFHALTHGTASDGDTSLRPTLSAPQAVQPALEGPAATSTIICSHFPDLSPLPVYAAPRSELRLTVVTDSVGRGSLYGGVGTALILAALTARRLDASLRLVTRTEAADMSPVGALLKVNGIPWERNIETIFAPRAGGSGGHDVPASESDLFLTTSWWTTWSTRQSVAPGRIAYLVQEDERMFYPLSDEYLRCTEMLSSSDMLYIVNSNLLLQHFQGNGLMLEATAFEPSFPANLYHLPAPAERQPGQKRNFFFYARPHNSRNLYWRGLEALAAAIEEGVLDPAEWNFYFAGHGSDPISLPKGAKPIMPGPMAWVEYAAFVRKMDVGLSLMYTPHPSYPPLDLAASGSVVVTNRFGSKDSLDRYSPNIICSDLDVPALVTALRQATVLADNAAFRVDHFKRNGLQRDWSTSMAPALDRLASWSETLS